ncbi:uncharacterized protein ASCRUDRAFT_78298 [Ascoidea rubescens DSM 1968]|uniref:Uncharacterized protein n=1 Tax=Ascoidea rubescens DSM 1968 TaxID=1344418 RepID=A0A1D2V8F7_9ASCO|nr:hypothetical protein ASCRUDRAFT_78298 [Ascoidea rubescens DSM 1968]ODV57932.1 hypothetical protein ASCRUDRAFT_78298 [Ascoidea rubescens DSM 1968]
MENIIVAPLELEGFTEQEINESDDLPRDQLYITVSKNSSDSIENNVLNLNINLFCDYNYKFNLNEELLMKIYTENITNTNNKNLSVFELRNLFHFIFLQTKLSDFDYYNFLKMFKLNNYHLYAVYQKKLDSENLLLLQVRYKVKINTFSISKILCSFSIPEQDEDNDDEQYNLTDHFENLFKTYERNKSQKDDLKFENLILNEEIAQLNKQLNKSLNIFKQKQLELESALILLLNSKKKYYLENINSHKDDINDIKNNSISKLINLKPKTDFNYDFNNSNLDLNTPIEPTFKTPSPQKKKNKKQALKEKKIAKPINKLRKKQPKKVSKSKIAQFANDDDKKPAKISNRKKRRSKLSEELSSVQGIDISSDYNDNNDNFNDEGYIDIDEDSQNGKRQEEDNNHEANDNADVDNNYALIDNTPGNQTDTQRDNQEYDPKTNENSADSSDDTDC